MLSAEKKNTCVKMVGVEGGGGVGARGGRDGRQQTFEKQLKPFKPNSYVSYIYAQKLILVKMFNFFLKKINLKFWPSLIDIRSLL